MTFVSELEPTILWKHFDQLMQIPRGSKNEAAVAAYVMKVAQANGCEAVQDAIGNVLIRKPGTSGAERAPVTILQSHLDMVNEKNSDVAHDFSKDPIRPRREGDYLMAQGTTLGSDNGIGVASALAMLEGRDLSHGPLELLFTVDEETGLTGAAGLEDGFLRGRQLINLDTEEDGAIYVGCAGGAGVDISLNCRFSAPPGGVVFTECRLKGLRGGHSGVDIHLQRGNAVQLLARALNSAGGQKARLALFEGGNMHNAIPREARAVVALEAAEEESFRQKVEAELQLVQREYATADPGITWELEQVKQYPVLSVEDSARVIYFLLALPHGVQMMSNDIPDLVETSANLATVRTESSRLLIHVSNRSSVDSALEALQQRIKALALLAGAEAEFKEGYPGWQPDLKSPLLKMTREVYRQKIGRDPIVKAVHAGLECGLIGVKFPGMDMVSIGPQIEFPHSPDERVKIDSVARYFDVLCGVLERVAQEKA